MKRILPLLLMLVLVLNGCKGATTSTPDVAPLAVATLVPLGTPVPKYGQEVARPLIRDFATIGSRVAGSQGEAQTAQYIEAVFKAIGYSPETQAVHCRGRKHAHFIGQCGRGKERLLCPGDHCRCAL